MRDGKTAEEMDMNSNWFKIIMEITKVDYGKNLLLFEALNQEYENLVCDFLKRVCLRDSVMMERSG